MEMQQSDVDELGERERFVRLVRETRGDGGGTGERKSQCIE